MLAWTVVLILAVIASIAWVKPDWFTHVWETTVAWSAVIVTGAVPILWEVALYLTTDTSWSQLINESYRPAAFVAAGILGIIIRRVNT